MNVITEIEQKYNVCFEQYYNIENIEIIIDEIFNKNNVNLDVSKSYILNLIGLYYEIIVKDYKKMEKYYLKAIELNDTNASGRLGRYYENIEKNYREMKKYYLMAVKTSCCCFSLCRLSKTFKTDLDFYVFLKQIENKNELILSQLQLLETDKNVIKYNNNLGNIKECDICYKTDINIQFTCGHEVCYNCYQNMDKCHFRC